MSAAAVSTIRDILGGAFTDDQIRGALSNTGGDVESAVALLLDGGAGDPVPAPAPPPAARPAPAPAPAPQRTQQPPQAAPRPAPAPARPAPAPVPPIPSASNLQGQSERRNIELVRLPTEMVPELPAMAQLGQDVSFFCAPKRSESQASITQSLRPAAPLAVDTTKQKRCRFSTQGAVQMATTADSAFWVSASGRLYRWQLEPAEQPGLGQFQEERLPESPASGPAPRLQRVACGGNFVIALTEDGALFARGNNGFGQLGQDNDMPYSPGFLRVPYEKLVTAVSAGHAFAALLSVDGEVATWGEGKHGQLGHGPGVGVLRRPTPVAALRSSAHPVRSITCGPDHAVAVDAEGTVLAWGRTGLPRSLAERLMSGAKRAVPSPVPGAPRDVVQVACGGAFDVEGHTALLTARGEVHSFGRGAEGQLGHHYKFPEAPCSQAHMDGALIGHVTHVSCTAYATYLRNERGQALRWGLRQRGIQPVSIDRHHVADIVCSRYHAIAVCVVASSTSQPSQQPPAVQMVGRGSPIPSAIATSSPTASAGGDSQRAGLPRSSSASSGRSPKPHIPLLPLSELAERTAAAERERAAHAAASAAAPAVRAATNAAAAAASRAAAPVVSVQAPTPAEGRETPVEPPHARAGAAPPEPEAPPRPAEAGEPAAAAAAPAAAAAAAAEAAGSGGGSSRRSTGREQGGEAGPGAEEGAGEAGALAEDLRGRAFSESEAAFSGAGSARPMSASEGEDGLPPAPGPPPAGPPEAEEELPDLWRAAGPAPPDAEAVQAALGSEAFGGAPAGREELGAALGDEAFGAAFAAPPPPPLPPPPQGPDGDGPLVVAATTAAVVRPNSFTDESEEEEEEEEGGDEDGLPPPPWGPPKRQQLQVSVPSPTAKVGEVSELFRAAPPPPAAPTAAAHAAAGAGRQGLTAAAVMGALNLSDLDFAIDGEPAAPSSPSPPLPQAGAKWPPDPRELAGPPKTAAHAADDSDDEFAFPS